jgi:hypothetical protein
MLAESAVSVAIAKSTFSFALMAVIAMASAVFIRGLVVLLGAANRRIAGQRPAAAPPAAAKVAAPVAEGVDPNVVAVIAAAVNAAIGPARIVWIGESATGSGWISETRVRHHLSHNPHDH